MKVRCDVVAGLASADHAHTVRLGAVVPSDSGPDLERRLTRRFAERIYLHRIRVPRTGVDVIEVFDPSVNKWAGILKVAATRGIAPEAIIAVGDDLNEPAHGSGRRPGRGDGQRAGGAQGRRGSGDRHQRRGGVSGVS